VLKTLDIKDNLYRVQVGAFRNKEYAENLLKELKGKGYKGFIKG
jgi:N-acetylmuramoyl-L-alanine amidase